MQGAFDELDKLGIAWEFDVRSAHRTPDAVAEYAKTARDRGLRVLIAGAGLAAALPGLGAGSDVGKADVARRKTAGSPPAPRLGNVTVTPGTERRTFPRQSGRHRYGNGSGAD